jgi:hypothetical protein
MAIALALLTIGARRAVSALLRKPIPDVAKDESKPSKFGAALTRRFPSLDLNADLPVSRRVGRAGLAGFAMCGLHPKVFPIAIAAGHQIVQIANAERPILSAPAVLYLVPADALRKALYGR